MTEDFVGDDNINWDEDARRNLHVEKYGADDAWQDLKIIDYFSGFLESGMKILDLGCGVSRWNVLFRKLGLKYEGLDACPTAIQNVRRFFPSNTYYLSLAQEMAFHEEYDLIFSHTVFQHIHLETKNKVLPKVWNALKKNGLFVIEEKCDVETLTTFTRAGWIGFIEGHGFKYLKGTPDGDDRDGFVFRKV